MLVVGKEGSTLSTLWIVSKTGQEKLYAPTDISVSLAVGVGDTYFWSSLRNLFIVFLETKTQLWKLMWAISGCCIGSSGSPLHPPLKLNWCPLSILLQKSVQHSLSERETTAFSKITQSCNHDVIIILQISLKWICDSEASCCPNLVTKVFVDMEFCFFSKSRDLTMMKLSVSFI